MESSERIEQTAPMLEEAIILGLARLGLTRDEVEIEILDEGSRGFLGLGVRDAHVRLTAKPAPVPAPAPVSAPLPPVVVAPPPQPEPVLPPAPPMQKVRSKPAPAPQPKATPPKPPAQPSVSPRPKPIQPSGAPVDTGDLDRDRVERVALDVAGQLLAGFVVQVQVSWRIEDAQPLLWLDIRGKDASLLVGNRAKTLDNLQYLYRVLVRRLADGNYDLMVDADGYRDRRRRKLQSLAGKAADRAVSSGRSVRMAPLPAHERRLVHMFLREDARVKTRSDGKGAARAITVIPVTAEEA